MKKLFLIFISLILSWNALGQAKKINEIYSFTFLPDGNKIIGIAKHLNKIKIRIWDINTIKEINSFILKDTFSHNNEYKLSTSKSGKYLAIAVKQKTGHVNSIYIYEIKNGNLIKIINVDNLFNDCRHQLLTLEFSSNDKYLYFSDIHNAYNYNFDEENIKLLFKNEKIILLGYDINHDTPIISKIKISGSIICPDLNNVFSINDGKLNKIKYDKIPITHNSYVSYHDANKRIDMFQLYTDPMIAQRKNYMISNISGKIIAFQGNNNIIEIF